MNRGLCFGSRVYVGGFVGGLLISGKGSIPSSGVYFRLFRIDLFCLLSLKCVVCFDGFCIF